MGTEHADVTRWPRRFLVLLVLVAMVVLSACEAQITNSVNDARSNAGRGALPTTDALTTAARSHSSAMCSARAVFPSTSPAAAYQEGTYEVHELVGRAPLDPAITDAVQRNVAATSAVWSQWRTDPELTDPSLHDQAAGEVQCSDGYLYETLVLRKTPPLPASGIYSTPQYDPSRQQAVRGLVYGSAVDVHGTTVSLALDLFVPPAPAPTPHPVVILIHGGAFVGGSRTDEGSSAAAWVARGFAVMAPDYRLDDLLNGPHTAADELQAATNGILDVQESVRYLKANASTYHLDPQRIAAVGNSAGGAIALGLSAVPDTHPASPYAAYSPSITAAVSTGAYLTPGFDAGVLHLTGSEPPILMFHYETDVASAPGPYAYRTCTAYRAAGDSCDYVSQPGEGHTADLLPGSTWWADPLGPFVYEHLHLG